ncbi:hypothetical protein DXX93_02640 [Thalassotalea euphylliae]|uniref:MAPEG family protein n=1 Tax=Thalassotalea euphylliae TaxID=1655234 RepID=A0A3E0TMC8_9GAMM|nr:MAPEG family protein [Thalassotalea euphylliae]REL25553.1 hypothetical protein DXX93_02640 [Thalassotalea euphylliae]
MITSPLHVPVAIMIGLTLLVWLFMYARRLTFLLRNQIDADRLKAPESVSQIIPPNINAPSNNLKNLFEMPVLFYALVLIAMQSNLESDLVSLSAWAFVLLRIPHSVIHCLNGPVMARFVCYLLSSAALIVMALNVFGQLFA